MTVHHAHEDLFGHRRDRRANASAAGYTWRQSRHDEQVHLVSMRWASSVQHGPHDQLGAHALPERFPKLKVVWIESGIAWLPFMIQRLDNEYMMRSSECPGLKKLPGEYITDMFYTSQPMEVHAT